MNDTPFDPTHNLFNPATKDPDRLLAEFIDRKNILARILDILRHNTKDRPQQHVVVIGPRGMGKTTLLCAIQYRVEKDPELNAAWLPILFSEEQYNIGDLADFWLECVRHLETALHRRERTAEKLLDQDTDDLDELARQTFFRLLGESGKRAILLVDNLNDLLRDIDDGDALNRLRALWMTDPRITLIGASPSYFEQITAVDQAFHDFFRTFSLDRLTQEELETFLRRLAHLYGDEQVIRAIETTPHRVAALRILSGGNPRLVMYGYRMLRDGLEGDARHDLERLLNECTPFFKHRIDSLKAKELRRTFDAIARRWDPITVDEIRKELRKPSNYISAQIKRLIAEGFVEESGGDKKKQYQVSERFYNVYYLMRYSREGRRRLHWLVAFMQTFYSRKDFREWAKRVEAELKIAPSESQRAEKLSHLHALSAAADSDGRGAAFDAIVRDAIERNDRAEIDEDCADGDPVETHGWRYIAAEFLWLLAPEIRKKLGFEPSVKAWWRRLREAIGQAGLTEQYKIELDQLDFVNSTSACRAIAAGVIFEWFFSEHTEAEAAFRKAIEIDPQYAYAWYNLGIALYNQSRYSEAETAFRKAIEIDPQYIFAWNNLGIALAAQGRHIEAEVWRKTIEIDAPFAFSWKGLGYWLGARGRYSKAEATYRRAIEIDSQVAIVWNNLGNALHEQRRYTEAEAAYRKAIEIDPQDTIAWNNLSGTYLFGLKQNETGIHALTKGLALDPDESYGRYVLGQFWQETLPVAARQIIRNEAGSDNLQKAMTETLLLKASGNDRNTVRDALLKLDATEAEPFEALLLALRALDDPALLYRISREKREVVLDVMRQIAPETQK